MIPNYIKNIVDNIPEYNRYTQRLKLVHEQETHYDKFYRMEDATRNFYTYQYNIEDIVERINIKDKNLILDYCLYDDGIYLKCDKKQKYYNFFEIEKKFDSYSSYFDYAIEQINLDIEAYYPFTPSDYNYGNIFIQKDLSWINVDLDEFFDVCQAIPQFDYSRYIEKYNSFKGLNWPNLVDINSWKKLPVKIQKECSDVYNFSLEKDYQDFYKIKEKYIFDYKLKLAQKILRLTYVPVQQYNVLNEKIQSNILL